jgi:hypothetical protein
MEGNQEGNEGKKLVNKWRKKEAERKSVQWKLKERESFDRAHMFHGSQQSWPVWWED